MIMATIPDQQSLRRASKTSLSRMSCAMSPSRSKGSKQSPMSLPGRVCVALVRRLARARLESGQLPLAHAMVKTARGPLWGKAGGSNYGAHVGERALVISATARLVAPADLGV